MKYVEGSKKVFLKTGTRFPRRLIWAVALVKEAAAKTNVTLGLLDASTSAAIIKASKEVETGKHDDEVSVDVFQTGSGTGINMNINELVAELASRLLRKKVHPKDQVNLGQSSNDVGPTAIRISSCYLVVRNLIPSLQATIDSLDELAKRTSRVYKTGRTHLRDALPVTMGQEFGAYASAFEHDLIILSEAIVYVRELPIGGAAVGTGLNTHPRFGQLMCREISRKTGIRFVAARNKFRPTKFLTDLVSLSGGLRVIALDLYRLCQDLRLMYSGPKTGLSEIDIPSQEEVAGSSIMPGKTNPVTVESVLLACAQVLGMDHANQVASMLGEFELSMGIPLVGYNLAMQIELLSESLRKISSVVLDRLVPDKELNRRYAENSQALVTVISPKVGYDRAAAIGKKIGKGLSTREALRQMGYSEKQINQILDLRRLVRPGFPAKEVKD
ncbi:MAG: class II fumarate hydratase [Thaumarchaeota archaeon]|nr:class II fumarate hydratase [Nitrososphaerota archaeon]